MGAESDLASGMVCNVTPSPILSRDILRSLISHVVHLTYRIFVYNPFCQGRACGTCIAVPALKLHVFGTEGVYCSFVGFCGRNEVETIAKDPAIRRDVVRILVE